MKKHFLRTTGVVAVLGLGLFLPPAARAHCDTMDGPVVSDALAALEAGEPAAVLKWVGPKDEPEIRKAFDEAVVVRRTGPDAKRLADRYFLETLVRVHRAGEGAPYTGLKPAGMVAPYIAGADRALASGDVDALVKQVTDDVAKGIRERFAHASATKPHAAESVASGREYVETYVGFTHYLEALQQVTDGHGALGHGEAAPEAGHGH